MFVEITYYVNYPDRGYRQVVVNTDRILFITIFDYRAVLSFGENDNFNIPLSEVHKIIKGGD